MNVYTLSQFRDAADKCDPRSPLERRLLRALLDHCWPDILDRTVDGNILHDHPHMRLCIQFQKHRYTTDFALCVMPPGLGQLWVAIECDGHEYHDKTKEQADRDRARDRHFQALGWEVARYTGTQVNASAEWCARDVAHMVTSAYANRVKTECESQWGRLQCLPLTPFNAQSNVTT